MPQDEVEITLPAKKTKNAGRPSAPAVVINVDSLPNIPSTPNSPTSVKIASDDEDSNSQKKAIKRKAEPTTPLPNLPSTYNDQSDVGIFM